MSLPSRIVFMGSDPIALPMLEALRRERPELRFTGVFTQPDRRTGRGMKLHANAIKEWAEGEGIPVFQPLKPGAEEAEWLAEHADLAIVMAYGHLLRKSLLRAPIRGMVNLHASLLPKFRGASPIDTALAVGEPETGVSLMRVAPKMDAGPVLDQERVAITLEDTCGTLHRKMAAACAPLMLRNIDAILDGTAQFTPQDEAEVTYCRILTKHDGALDFTQSARLLDCRIRAFQPWPGAFFEFEGIRIKVGQASVVPDAVHTAAPGTVLKEDKAGVEVATGEGVLRLEHLQRPGGRMMPAADFLRGFSLPEGVVLPSEPGRPLVSDAPMKR